MPEIGEIRRGDEIGKIASLFYIWLACRDCGAQRWVGHKHYQAGKCSSCRLCHAKKENRGEKSPGWKGGRHETANGYIEVLLQPNDAFYAMTDKRGCVLEHRLIMAQSIGRSLSPEETIHHKDEVRNNNDVENLELTTASAHMKEHLSRRDISTGQCHDL